MNKMRTENLLFGVSSESAELFESLSSFQVLNCQKERLLSNYSSALFQIEIEHSFWKHFWKIAKIAELLCK